MFNFWFEKIISRLIPLVAFASIFVIIFYAFFTVVTVPPAENVPFVQEIRSETHNKNIEQVYNFDKPHRSDNEIKSLLTTVVSESLTFSKDDINDVMKQIRPYYNERGFESYKNYLINSGIIDSIRDNSYDVHVYIEQEPLYLNSSVIDGLYKWLYQMPVVISFFPKGKKAEAKDTDNFINKKITLRLQITRVKQKGNPDAMLVENWDVSARQ